MNRVDIKYSDAILIKCVLKAVLNDVRDGESLTCSGKSFHNEDTAETNDLNTKCLFVLFCLQELLTTWYIGFLALISISFLVYTMEHDINPKDYQTLPDALWYGLVS